MTEAGWVNNNVRDYSIVCGWGLLIIIRQEGEREQFVALTPSRDRPSRRGSRVGLVVVNDSLPLLLFLSLSLSLSLCLSTRVYLGT